MKYLFTIFEIEAEAHMGRVRHNIILCLLVNVLRPGWKPENNYKLMPRVNYRKIDF